MVPKRGKMIDKIKQMFLNKSNDYEGLLIKNINKIILIIYQQIYINYK